MSILDQYTDSVIKEKAETLLSDFYSASEQPEAPIPVFDIIEHLGYDIDFRSDGIYKDPEMLGGVLIEDRKVEFNESLQSQEGRLNFTAAHEIGHIVLHIPIYDKIDYHRTTRHDILCRSSEGMMGVDYKQIEIQADKFASNLLIPNELVETAFFDIYRSPINISKKSLLDYIYRSTKNSKARHIAGKVVSAGSFENVSNLAMINKLIQMKLLRGIKFQKYNKRERLK